TVEEAADLASPYHADHQRREDARMLLQCIRQREADLDVSCDVAKRIPQSLVLGLLGEDRERLKQRETGADHRRRLTRHDGEILETDALAPSDFDLAVEAGTGLRLKHRDGCQTERAHAIDSGALRRRVEATLDHL